MVGILTAKPDPNLYDAQKKVADQKLEVMETLQETTNLVNDAATKLTEDSGISQETLDQFKVVQEKLKKLAAAAEKMTPDRIELDRQAIEKSMKELLQSYTEQMNAKTLEAAQEVYDKAKARVDSTKSDKTLSPDVKKKYVVLMEKAKQNLESVKGLVAASSSVKGVEGFQDVSGAKYKVGPKYHGIFNYDPIGSNTDTLAIEMQHVDALSSYSTRQSGLSTVAHTIITCFIIISVILGGIVASNQFIGYNYWPIRLYYFIYGAVFFPIVLLYGVVFPPEWRCSFLPIFEYEEDNLSTNFFLRSMKQLVGYIPPPKDREDEDEDDKKKIMIWRMILRVLCALSTGVFGYGIYFMKVNVLDAKK